MYKENIFTQILLGHIKKEFFLEDKFGVVFSDKEPKSRIHYLVLSRSLKVDLFDFYSNSTNEEIIGISKLIALTIQSLKIEKSFQVITNGGKIYQEIGHCHWHIMSH